MIRLTLTPANVELEPRPQRLGRGSSAPGGPASSSSDEQPGGSPPDCSVSGWTAAARPGWRPVGRSARRRLLPKIGAQRVDLRLRIDRWLRAGRADHDVEARLAVRVVAEE